MPLIKATKDTYFNGKKIPQGREIMVTRDRAAEAVATGSFAYATGQWKDIRTVEKYVASQNEPADNPRESPRKKTKPRATPHTRTKPHKKK